MILRWNLMLMISCLVMGFDYFEKIFDTSSVIP